MKRSTRMLLMNTSRNENRDYNRDMRGGMNEDMRYNMDGGMREDMRINYDHSGYGGSGAESKFRDRRGREHYDNGRYAPMNGGDMWVGDNYDMDRRMGRMDHINPESHYPMTTPYVQPVYQTYDMGRRDGNRPMNKIGFSVDGEMGRAEEFRREYPSEVGYHQPMNEMQSRSGSRQKGYASGGSGHLTKEMAHDWVSSMENEDGSTGPHWSMDQIKQVMAQYGVSSDPYKFWVAMNAVYSDLGPTLKKYGVNSIDAYVDLAKAFWLQDKDAVGDKLAAYYEAVVKH